MLATILLISSHAAPVVVSSGAGGAILGTTGVLGLLRFILRA